MDQKGGVRVTARQIAFCLAYAGSGNATQSAIEAGYSEKTANEQASRLLANVNIQNYLKELQEQNASKKIADAREMQEVTANTAVRTSETSFFINCLHLFSFYAKLIAYML